MKIDKILAITQDLSANSTPSHTDNQTCELRAITNNIGANTLVTIVVAFEYSFFAAFKSTEINAVILGKSATVNAPGIISILIKESNGIV